MGYTPPYREPDDYFQKYKVNFLGGFEEVSDRNDSIKSTENKIDFQSSLSPQEQKVFNYLMQGFTTAQISQKMNVSKQWVCVLKSTIKDKLMAVMTE